jgi:hypothetical protein
MVDILWWRGRLLLSGIPEWRAEGVNPECSTKGAGP